MFDQHGDGDGGLVRRGVGDEPGLVAQVVFRHKTAKAEFANMSALIAAIHIVVLTLLITGSIQYPGAI